MRITDDLGFDYSITTADYDVLEKYYKSLFSDDRFNDISLMFVELQNEEKMNAMLKVEKKVKNELDLLKIMFELMHEVNGLFYESYFVKTVTSAESDHNRINTLILIHNQIKRKLQEIYTLLSQGLINGCYSLWRSMYELLAVMSTLNDAEPIISYQFFIKHRYDSLMIERSYLSNEYVNIANKFDGRLDEIKDEIKELDKHLATLNIDVKSLKKDYGWASNLYKKGKKGPITPRMNDLVRNSKEKIGMFYPFYTLSNKYVHTNSFSFLKDETERLLDSGEFGDSFEDLVRITLGVCDFSTHILLLNKLNVNGHTFLNNFVYIFHSKRIVSLFEEIKKVREKS